MDEGRQFRVHPGHHRLEAHGRPMETPCLGTLVAFSYLFKHSLTLFTLPQWTYMDIVDHTLALLIPSVGLCLAV